MYQKVVERFLILVTLTLMGATWAEIGEPEKDELTFGFIKLTDMAPIAIALIIAFINEVDYLVVIVVIYNSK